MISHEQRLMLAWPLPLWKYSFREELWAGSLCWGQPGIGAKVWGGNREGGKVNAINVIHSKMWYEADPPQKDVWKEDKKNCPPKEQKGEASSTISHPSVAEYWSVR